MKNKRQQDTELLQALLTDFIRDPNKHILTLLTEKLELYHYRYNLRKDN